MIADRQPRQLDPAAIETTLFGAVLEAARAHGGAKPVLEDIERNPLSYKRLILGSMVLGAKLTAGTRPGAAVGVLLPNVNGMVVTLIGLNAFGRVAALLNFTAGARNLVSAVKTGMIETVVTSRRFVEQAKLEDVVAAIAEAEPVPGKRVAIVYLEDVRRSIGTADKLIGLARSLIAGAVHRRHALQPDRTAVLLFTSGTEGTPKGVALSSRNLVANARQIYTHADGVLSARDTMMNPLPMFHSYGLTAGTLMPLLHGLKVVLYPSPLHYKQVPKLVHETQASVMVATDTFLQGYGRAADPDDLKSVRFVVAGAERVKDATRALWRKTGTEILEGYGCTECSPVLACSLPTAQQPGSVGRLLPAIEHRLEPVEGIAEGGKLMVKGPNVMLGYMLADQPGVIVPPAGGWHDTGDIVTIDGGGFVTIRGRAKRFAKIGGEMVSLAAVEAMAAGLWPEGNHVVIGLPDPRKGEQLVLVTDRPDADKDALLRHAQAAGFPEIWVPKAIMVVGAIPVLGSGKTDFPAATEMVRQARPLL
jgi:acyl-[acyl-carrier-protein]-phospholipid O-acyltransferase/long-chain-fatty-acid--[acyl-carrier-protein] ligase